MDVFKRSVVDFCIWDRVVVAVILGNGIFAFLVVRSRTSCSRLLFVFLEWFPLFMAEVPCEVWISFSLLFPAFASFVFCLLPSCVLGFVVFSVLSRGVREEPGYRFPEPDKQFREWSGSQCLICYIQPYIAGNLTWQAFSQFRFNWMPTKDLIELTSGFLCTYLIMFTPHCKKLTIQ